MPMESRRAARDIVQPMKREREGFWEEMGGFVRHWQPTSTTSPSCWKATNRPIEAEPLMRRHVEIFLDFERATGHQHPHRDAVLGNYAGLLEAMGKSDAEIRAALAGLAGTT
jgi:hypothetical protein